MAKIPTKQKRIHNKKYQENEEKRAAYMEQRRQAQYKEHYFSPEQVAKRHALRKQAEKDVATALNYIHSLKQPTAPAAGTVI